MVDISLQDVVVAWLWCCYIVLSQFCLGYKCSAPCCEEDFSGQTNYGTYSTVILTTFLSFLLIYVKYKYNTFHWHYIQWIEWNVIVFCFLLNMTKQMERHMSIVIVDVFVFVLLLSFDVALLFSYDIGYVLSFYVCWFVVIWKVNFIS